MFFIFYVYYFYRFFLARQHIHIRWTNWIIGPRSSRKHFNQSEKGNLPKSQDGGRVSPRMSGCTLRRGEPRPLHSLCAKIFFLGHSEIERKKLRVLCQTRVGHRFWPVNPSRQPEITPLFPCSGNERIFLRCKNSVLRPTFQAAFLILRNQGYFYVAWWDFLVALNKSCLKFKRILIDVKDIEFSHS